MNDGEPFDCKLCSKRIPNNHLKRPYAARSHHGILIGVWGSHLDSLTFSMSLEVEAIVKHNDFICEPCIDAGIKAEHISRI